MKRTSLPLQVKRRDFITLLGGAAAAWPLAARAQQGERMRSLGALTGITDEPVARARAAVFTKELEQLGWSDGRNIRIDYRWGGGDPEIIRRQAAELVALAPDVILATGGPALERMLQVTRSIPIVFAVVPDPVGSGFVARLSRPGGNATGFMQFEYGLSGKWLELLKQLVPGVTQAAVLRDPRITAGIGQFAVIQAEASSLGIEVTPINTTDAGEIERAVADFARGANGGLVITAAASAIAQRELIIALAERYRLPAVYSARDYVSSGGLISYAADFTEQYRGAARYVDRILKGAKPADLPVQAPTKYELVINLKTAKAIGIDIPPTLLARADEVIE
jgi:putative tryptophan/tyrosine transport system substrate-binding protein